MWCGGSDGTADGWVTISGLREYANCGDGREYANCGDGHAGVVAGQSSGVWVDGNVVEDVEERLLVQDQVIDVGSKD